jgi:hypothetical protein
LSCLAKAENEEREEPRSSECRGESRCTLNEWPIRASASRDREKVSSPRVCLELL